MRQLSFPSGWISLTSGLVLFAVGVRSGTIVAVLLAIPATLIIAGGGRCLLSPDVRGPQHVALGAVLAIVLIIPVWILADGQVAFWILGSSTVALIASGWFQIRLQPTFDEVPSPRPTPIYSLRVALDNFMVAPFALLTRIPEPDALRQAVNESVDAYQLFGERGWLDEPWTYHQAPPAPESVDVRALRIGGIECELLRFDSDYQPPADVPGRDRWLDYRNNRSALALILRHKEPAPWLVCIHGFGMGNFKQDVHAFRARAMHESFGLNIALFTLPVHGARAPRGFNGARFVGLSPMDFVHAESQAIWDLRRLLLWIRAQGDPQIAVHGISLGGYTSAVLAGLDVGISCVIAGVPPTDFLSIGLLVPSTLEDRIRVAAGVDVERDRAIQTVVAPLCMTPKVPRDGRFIYAATCDQFVPVEQSRALWEHWGCPDISWCTGAHVSALLQSEPRRLVDEAIERMSGTHAAGQR